MIASRYQLTNNSLFTGPLRSQCWNLHDKKEIQFHAIIPQYFLDVFFIIFIVLSWYLISSFSCSTPTLQKQKFRRNENFSALNERFTLIWDALRFWDIRNEFRFRLILMLFDKIKDSMKFGYRFVFDKGSNLKSRSHKQNMISKWREDLISRKMWDDVT